MQHVLLVVDDEAFVAAVANALDPARARISAARDGDEALAVVASSVPDVVVTDVRAGSMDGYSLCRAIRSDERARDVPVILLTSLTNPEDALLALDAGVDRYLEKPLNEVELLTALDELMGSRPGGPADRLRSLYLSSHRCAVRRTRRLLRERQRRKEAEQALREARRALRSSDKRFDTVVQTVQDIVYRVEAHGKFTFVNDAVRRLGFEPNELVGAHFSVLVGTTQSRQIGREDVLPRFKGRVTGPEDAPKLFDERRTGHRQTKELHVVLRGKASKAGRDAVVEPLDSEPIYAEASSAGLYEEDPDTGAWVFVGSVGVLRDVSEQARGEEQIRLQNALLRAQSDATVDGVLVLSMDNRVISFNERFVDMWGIPREVIEGASARQVLQQLSRACKDGNTFWAALRRETTPGGDRPIEVALTSGHVLEIYQASARGEGVESGGQVLVFRDVTHQKQAELELLEHKDRLEELVERRVAQLLEATKELERESSQRSRLEGALRQAERELRLRHRVAQAFLAGDDESAFGRTLDAVLESTGSTAGMVGRLDAAGHLAAQIRLPGRPGEAGPRSFPRAIPATEWIRFWKTAMEQRQPVAVGRPTPLVEGSTPSEHALAVPIVLGQASIGVLVVAEREADYGPSDIMLLERLAENVAPVIDARSRRIEEERERTKVRAALERSEEMLRQAQKMEAVGRLAGGVAHDFNNYLGSILGYAGLLLREMSQTDPRRRDLEEIRTSAEKAAALTAQLLTFSRTSPLHPIVMDLGRQVSEFARMLPRLLGEHISVDLRLAQHPLRVKGDPGQLEQVLMNLVLNARDAMPNGGELTIETRRSRLRDTSPHGQEPLRIRTYALLVVTDTGVGMDEETRARVFEPFFTTKVAGKGTGLGLATVFGIVSQGAGAVSVQSKPGRGATFTVRLPEVEEPIPEVPVGPRREPEPEPGRGTILLVEDVETLRTLVARMLEGLGYVVLQAGDAESAVTVAAGYPDAIDLLVSDVVLPVGSGPGLAEKLHEQRPSMGVLFVSGYPDDVLEQYPGIEPDEVLRKPFREHVLVSRVKAALRQAADPLPK